MKRSIAICAVGGLLLSLSLALVGLRFAEAQPNAPALEPTSPAAPASPLQLLPPPLPQPTSGSPVLSSPSLPTKPQDTVYDLLQRLADIKRQKAELDKAEKETTARLQKELKSLQEQSEKLGVGVERSFDKGK